MLNWTPHPDWEIRISRDQEEWAYAGRVLACIHAHLHLREPGRESGRMIRAVTVDTGAGPDAPQIVLSAETQFGIFSARYLRSNDGVMVEAAFTFQQDWYGGLDFILLQRLPEFSRCRFYDMLVSGWSDTQHGIMFLPRFDGPAKLTFCHENNGAVQCMGLSCPAGIFLGQRRFAGGETVTGSMEIRMGKIDVWDPDISGPMQPRTVAPKPARSFSAYIDKWLAFTRQPGLWSDLDGDRSMGMFHRGWFNFLADKKISGVLWQGRETWNEPLIELAWGGSANMAVMETLFRLGDERAEKILRTLFYFQDGAFQREDGSWCNAYQPRRDRFSDRYGREHSEVATGGIVNMMLWRARKKQWLTPEYEDLFRCRLKIFCDRYLESMRSADGGIAFSRFWDGSPGAQREGIPYPDSCYPVSDAFGAYSFLIAYLLTNIRAYREKFMNLLDHLLGHLRANEWRFLEYDTLGADAVAPAWILLILDEVLEYEEELDNRQAQSVREQYHRTYRVLHSFIREREDYPDPEWKAADRWGGKTVTQGGIIHGSTPGSLQGAHSVHLRYDFPLAMGAYARRTDDPVAWIDWESYLNWTTHLQYTDERWPEIIGAATEHVTFRHGYVQDTAQIKHGNPIAMLEWLECREN